ncbi:MAG: carboxymuconolactone decarboxylase family protein [Acidobacteria bacterium]|nr:carboxymuconolactone decarboxylase family protein [Acidobacteriota bacterium]
MSRFLTIQDPGDRRALRAIYDEIYEAGFATQAGPINFYSAMGIRPDLLAGAWALTKATLVPGRLPPTLQHMIILAISAQNESHYCCIAHARALAAMGVPEEVIQSCLEDPDVTQVMNPTRAALLFTKQVAAASNSLTASHFEMMARNGFSQEEVLEMVMLAAFANWANTWANAADLVVEPGRVWPLPEPHSHHGEALYASTEHIQEKGA